jgi:predicted RNase H-like HicB family nuclease
MLGYAIANPTYKKYRGSYMKTYTAIVERCTETGLYVGYISGFSGAHTQAESLDKLNQNLKEVIEMLLEDGTPVLETEFVGIQNIAVA